MVLFVCLLGSEQRSKVEGIGDSFEGRSGNQLPSPASNLEQQNGKSTVGINFPIIPDRLGGAINMISLVCF